MVAEVKYRHKNQVKAANLYLTSVHLKGLKFVKYELQQTTMAS